MGNDTVDAGADNDVVDMGIGDDQVTGGTGNDSLTLGDGADSAIGDAGKDLPQIAVAAVVEQQTSTGGETAAPVAKEVVQALLGSASNS